jgi:transposase InsO family protein
VRHRRSISGCGNARVLHKPKPLRDNGSSYIAGDLADYLEGQGMKHVRGTPLHPQTQAKIERWHQTPADVYFGRVETIQNRRLNHQRQAA